MKIISLVDYASLPIMTANFDDGGVFFDYAYIRDELMDRGHGVTPTLKECWSTAGGRECRDDPGSILSHGTAK